MHKNFFTGDPSDTSHFDRTDIGVRTQLDIAIAPGKFAQIGLSPTLSYVFDGNHTNLHPSIAPVDTNDYGTHQITVGMTYRFGKSKKANEVVPEVEEITPPNDALTPEIEEVAPKSTEE